MMDKEKDTYDMIDMEGERFDRAYDFKELFPSSQLVSFFKGFSDLGLVFIGVLLPDGTLYYSTDNQRAESLCRSERVLDAIRIHSTQDLIHTQENMTILPLVHHFETMAFLVVEFSDDPAYLWKKQDALTVFIAKMLDQVMKSNFKNLMTSSLHSQVVKESYEEIRHKNELLEKSEKKYRFLAERLEKEVILKSEEIKEAHTQLMHQDKLASIGHLAAGVAHEINNPMGFISSNLKTLKDYVHDLTQALSIYHALCRDIESLFQKGLLDPESLRKLKERMASIDALDIEYIFKDIPHLLEESMEGSERINKIVSDLKNFAHPGDEEATSADLIECIESTLRIVWNELKYKTNVIRSYQKTPLINCFPRQLNQVILNLLVNAAQSIEKNGDIEISTRHLGDFVELSVRDTGQGISADALPKIFDPFFTTKEVGKGTGLGLNLAYNIIKKHKGRISVKSDVGKGTTFVIILPVQSDL